MRQFQFCLSLGFLVFSGLAWGQQTQQTLPPISAIQDPQAVTIMNQTLTVAGGTAAVKAIADYIATGTATYHWGSDEQGSVTIQALGLGEVRIDASLPSGTHSESIQSGSTSRKTPDGRLWKYPPPYPTPSSEAFPYQPSMFPGSIVIPELQLAAALINPRNAITYKGLVQVDGDSVYDIQIQRLAPNQTTSDVMTEYHTIDFFVDPNTMQVVMTQDNIPQHIVHQLRYSNYTTQGGISVPFNISERVGGQVTRDIQINKITFNTGLQDSAFVIQ